MSNSIYEWEGQPEVKIEHFTGGVCADALHRFYRKLEDIRRVGMANMGLWQNVLQIGDKGDVGAKSIQGDSQPLNYDLDTDEFDPGRRN